MHDRTDGRSLFEKAMTVSKQMARARTISRPMTAATLWVCLVLPALGGNLDPSAINSAQFSPKSVRKDKQDPTAVKAEILLDRAKFSPGESTASSARMLRRH